MDRTIERIWKYVKGRLRSKYSDRFDVFKETIDSIVEDTGKGNKVLADRLIGESVQIFDTLVPINGNSFIVNSANTENSDIAA
jgi:hypothetical protein